MAGPHEQPPMGSAGAALKVAACVCLFSCDKHGKSVLLLSADVFDLSSYVIFVLAGASELGSQTTWLKFNPLCDLM